MIGAALLLGCDRTQTLDRGPIVLTPNTWVRVAKEPFAIVGKTSDLCARIPPGYALADDGHALVGPGSRRVTVQIRLQRVDGQTLEFAEPSTLDDGRRKYACFRALDRPTGERYVAGAMRSSDSLVIRDVYWSSSSHWFEL